MKALRRALPILLVILALLASLGLETGHRPAAGPVPDGAELRQSEDAQGSLTAEELSSKKSGGKKTSSSGAKDAKGDFRELTEEELPEDGSYTTMEDVAGYLILYGHLPDNFVTKKEARDAGWNGGSVERYLPGMCIGGDYFGNYEGLLPKAKGRKYTECDINTLGKRSRGAERLIFSNDGLIYYTDDHYESFELIYGEE